MGFKSYRVWVKELGEWRWISEYGNINLLYVECLAKYYRDRNVPVYIEEVSERR